MNNTLYKIATLINSSNNNRDDMTYEDILESIYGNLYTSIYKVSTQLMLLGTLESFVIRDLSHANQMLTKIKRVIVEALEYSGIEVEYRGEDFLRLVVIPSHTNYKTSSDYKLSIDGKTPYNDKAYMSEFFEI